MTPRAVLVPTQDGLLKHKCEFLLSELFKNVVFFLSLRHGGGQSTLENKLKALDLVFRIMRRRTHL